SGSAVWGKAGAVIDSTTGNIFVATGNGRWDGRTNWGDAVLELDTDATRLLGNYTPENTEALDAHDADLGSTSPVLLGGGRIAKLECGRGHWNSPIVVDGRIALPEGNSNDHATSGILDIWRLRRRSPRPGCPARPEKRTARRGPRLLLGGEL